MVGLFLKNWKFLLDVVIVIALVILFFLWNPLNIFGNKLKLDRHRKSGHGCKRNWGIGDRRILWGGDCFPG